MHRFEKKLTKAAKLPSERSPHLSKSFRRPSAGMRWVSSNEKWYTKVRWISRGVVLYLLIRFE